MRWHQTVKFIWGTCGVVMRYDEAMLVEITVHENRDFEPTVKIYKVVSEKYAIGCNIQAGETSILRFTAFLLAENKTYAVHCSIMPN